MHVYVHVYVLQQIKKDTDVHLSKLQKNKITTTTSKDAMLINYEKIYRIKVVPLVLLENAQIPVISAKPSKWHYASSVI